jgi:hypothetical protein
MEPESRSDALRTYRYLRVALVVLGLLLLASVGGTMATVGCRQTSISAYYYTPSHAVFIAALCAIGVCLIVYRGTTDLEDVVLNISGFLAFVVAFSPTTREPLCGGQGLPADYDIAPGIRNNVAAFLVAGVLVVILMIYFGRRENRALDLSAQVALVIGVALFVVGAVLFVFSPTQFQKQGHGAATTVFFAGIIAVTLLNARSSGERVGAARYIWAYRVIAGVMTATLLVVIGMHLLAGRPTAAIIAETLLVVEFGAFWVVQTIELWGVLDKDELTQRAGAAR